ncbi:MAG: ABC transporter permease, partial [Pseudomonadota bacterium]
MSAFTAIDIKLLRDFRRLSVQGLAIALVLAAGVTVILMSVGMSRALEETLQTYYDRHRFAQVFASARRAPVTLLQEIQAIDGVATIEAQVRGYAVLDLPGRSDPATGLLISRPEFGEQRLNVPLLRSGHWPDPDSSQQVVVNEPFAEENGFLIGDRFVANLNGSRRELIITGTALSPEFVYTIGPGALMPDSSTYGILWMSAETVESAYGMSGAFSDISLTLVPRAPVEPVLDALDELLEPYGGEDAIEREDQVSNAFVQTEIEQLQTLAYILPPVFLGITVFLVNMVMGRIVFLERTEIGLMKAIGYSNTEICVHYLMLAGLIAVLGIGLGWVAGSWLAREMADLYAKYYDFPFLVFRVPSSIYALSAILGLAATSAGALRSALKAARLAPAVAMSPPAPPNFRQSFADRLMGLAGLAQPTRMILRSLVRWPMRAAMTSLGMALAVSVLVASNFFPDAMDEIVDKGFYQSNRQDYMLLFDEDEPLVALQEVQNLPGVLQAEPQQFHSAVLRSGHLEKRLAVSAFPKDADLSRIVDNEGRVITAGPAGVVISDRLADALNVDVGDVVTIEFQSGLRETFEVPVSAV